MRRGTMIAAALFGVSLLAGVAAAEQNDHQHMSPKMTDTRKEVEVPPPMRAHMLSNMRSHAEAISEILVALSQGDGAKASMTAESRLGLSAPGSAACKPGAATGELGEAPAMMARHMPDDMRALGMAMHEQASKFAEEAAKVKQGADLRPALAALAQVTQGCSACHAAYRLK